MIDKFMRIGEKELYQRDVAVVKEYRNDYYRIVLHSKLRRAGYEDIDGDNDKSDKGKKNTADNGFKLDASISRTRSKIFELAMCNDWDYMVNFTLNKELHNRNDLKNYKNKLCTWIKNYNRLNETDIKYLLIPEQHFDGAWHMHGLMMGLPIEHLTEFRKDEKLPIKILIKVTQGIKVYNWKKYAKAFGYNVIEPIMNAESVAKYITKYISKDLLKTRIDLNDHLFYCSHGLKRSKVIYKGSLSKTFEPDFENEYVKIKTVRSIEEALQYITDGNE
ncbi:MAG: hypothetical protein FWG36_09100 [Oscillospiraceae bacterium]|nr:hypothetical protein [Oscillospiraceae bacterium]